MASVPPNPREAGIGPGFAAEDDRHAGVARRRRRGRSRHRGHVSGGIREGCGDEGQRAGGREGVAASRRFVNPSPRARLFVGRGSGGGGCGTGVRTGTWRRWSRFRASGPGDGGGKGGGPGGGPGGARSRRRVGSVGGRSEFSPGRLRRRHRRVHPRARGVAGRRDDAHQQVRRAPQARERRRRRGGRDSRARD